MDELKPHIHCVALPLVKKLDKRTNPERFTISKKQYSKDHIHLSKLQGISIILVNKMIFSKYRVS